MSTAWVWLCSVSTTCASSSLRPALWYVAARACAVPPCCRVTALLLWRAQGIVEDVVLSTVVLLFGMRRFEKCVTRGAAVPSLHSLSRACVLPVCVYRAACLRVSCSLWPFVAQVGQVAVLTNFILNVIGTAWAFSLGAFSSSAGEAVWFCLGMIPATVLLHSCRADVDNSCNKPLYITMVAFSIAWLSSLVAMPLYVFVRLRCVAPPLQKG